MAELYTQILDLSSKDVYLQTENNDNTYFNVSGIPSILGYGKHPFTITYNDPEPRQPFLKNYSNIIFEFVDSRGTIIFSNLVDLEQLSGAANGFVWIKKDPLRTYEDIVSGYGTLTIVGITDTTDNSELMLVMLNP